MNRGWLFDSVASHMLIRFSLVQDCANRTAPPSGLAENRPSVVVVTQVDGEPETRPTPLMQHVRQRCSNTYMLRTCCKHMLCLRARSCPPDAIAAFASSFPCVKANVAGYGAISAALNAAWAKKMGYGFLVVGSVTLPKGYDGCA